LIDINHKPFTNANVHSFIQCSTDPTEYT